jgi:hypothetical protein
MAELIYSFSDLYNRVSQYLGTYGSSGPSGQNLTDAKAYVNDAYQRLIAAHEWPFLKPLQQLVTTSGTWQYELPSDFSSIVQSFQFTADKHYPPLEERSLNQIMEMRSVNAFNKWPEFYAIHPDKYDKTVGQRWLLSLYPTPDSAFTLWYRYTVNVDKLENDDDIPAGGVEYSRTLLQLCLAEAELQKEGTAGVHNAEASRMLADSIQKSKQTRPHNLGYNGSGALYSLWDIGRGGTRINDVSYDTTEWLTD